MPQIIEITKEGIKSYKDIQKENTMAYLKRIESEGMNIYTPQEINELLLNLGYKIEKSSTFNYYNNLNEGYSYLAKSCYIIDIKSGQSFAHFEQSFSNPHNLEKLQRIRRNSVGFDGVNIWDI